MFPLASICSEILDQEVITSQNLQEPDIQTQNKTQNVTSREQESIESAMNFSHSKSCVIEECGLSKSEVKNVNRLSSDDCMTAPAEENAGNLRAKSEIGPEINQFKSVVANTTSEVGNADQNPSHNLKLHRFVPEYVCVMQQALINPIFSIVLCDVNQVFSN